MAPGNSSLGHLFRGIKNTGKKAAQGSPALIAAPDGHDDWQYQQARILRFKAHIVVRVAVEMVVFERLIV